MAKSIMVDDMKCCILCKKAAEEHHVFFGRNRRVADKYGLVVPLCFLHHREGANAVHKNRAVDLALKCWGQNIYEEKIGTRDDFIREFGKSYL